MDIFLNDNYKGSNERYGGAIVDGDLDSWGPLFSMYELAETATFTIPWFLDKNRKDIKLNQTIKTNGRILIVLGYHNDSMVFYVDSENYRVRQFKHYAGSGWLYRRTTVIYSNFREVEGILFPHREIHYLAGFKEKEPGHLIGVIEIEKL